MDKQNNAFVGTKLVFATCMTRAAYNDIRGWDLPADEEGADLGYLIEDADGGAKNHPDYDGYISWTPKDIFDRHYRSNGTLSFGDALTALKAGRRVARDGWNGKGMFLFLVPGSRFKVNRPPLLGIYEEGTEINYHPHIDMKTADGQVVPWLCSQTDALAEDWIVLD